MAGQGIVRARVVAALRISIMILYSNYAVCLVLPVDVIIVRVMMMTVKIVIGRVRYSVSILELLRYYSDARRLHYVITVLYYVRRHLRLKLRYGAYQGVHVGLDNREVCTLNLSRSSTVNSAYSVGYDDVLRCLSLLGVFEQSD